jgi:hypothetical protein
VLNAHGIEAFTPVYKIRVRLPRKRASRVELRAAMPSFVFVPYPKMERALQLGDSGKVPKMTLFVFNRIVARVRSDQLEHLKAVSERYEEKPHYTMGARVVIASGNFIGLSGTVVMWDGTYNTVQLDMKGFHIKLPPFLLVEERI